MTGAVFDHVAVAVERWSDAWPRYAVELGGTWGSGGENVGFAPAQLRYANGGRVEILQPWQSEANPFLRRFLDHDGPGPHHMTFKVKDIAGALNAARGRGFNPVGVNVSNPYWMEAFLHPRQATGVVVQLAQSAEDWASPPPEGFPARRPRTGGPITPGHPRGGRHGRRPGLFSGLLGATRGPEGISADGSWMYVGPVVEWANAPAPHRPQPGRDQRGATSVDRWPDRAGAPSGVLLRGIRLQGDQDRPALPASVPGVLVSEDVEVIEPDANLGTRLVVLHGDQGPRS